MSALRAGVASTVITPPVGIPLSGWCFGASRGVHDDLYVRSLVLDDGSTDGPVVLITADLIGLGTAYADRIRAEVATKLSTSRTRVAVSCSHTHSGPGAMPLRRWGPIDDSYLETTIRAIIENAVRAASHSGPGSVGVGCGVVTGICENRRGDRGNVVDESLPVIRVDRHRGGDARRTLAVVMNYACHPVAGHGDRNLISADYPGFARRIVERELHTGGVADERPQALFTLGAAGDVNPTEFHKLELAESYGATIGAEAARVAGSIEPEESVTIDALSRTLRVPVQPLPSPEWLREESVRWRSKARQIQDERGEERDEADRPIPGVESALIKAEWAEEALEVVESGRALAELSMEMQVLRIGDAAIVSLPGELFVEIGLAIKDASPFEHTIIAELTNGSFCYIPTDEAYKRGGYETDFSAKVYGLYMLTEDAASIVRRSAATLLSELDSRRRDT